MSDYISREELLKEKWTLEYPDSSYEEVVSVTDIKNIPSADVRENVYAEWITHDTEQIGYFIECSNCNSVFGAYLPYKHFCPNCGCQMDK